MGIVDDRSHWQAETEEQPLLATTVGDLLDAQAAAMPNKEALVYAYPEIGLDLRLTYRDLQAAANAIAKGLMALGVEAGDKVAVLATNIPEWVMLEMALPKIGAVLVTVNTNSRQAELDYLLRQADVHTLVMIESYRGHSYVDAVRALVPGLTAFRQAVLIGDVAHAGFMPWNGMLAAGRSVDDAALRARQAAVGPDDVFQIQYTSGTTGAPKGAMITYRGTINNAAFVARRAGLGPDDRMVSAMPMFHTAGNIVDQLSMLVVGGTMVKAIAFDPAKMLELIDREGATVMDAVPTMIIAMLREPRFAAGEFDTSSLRVVITGGTPIPVPIMEEVRARLGAEPAIVLGMTEASPIIAQTLAVDSFELRSSTVGIPLPHTSVKIVDADGQVVPLGVPGELLVRGFGVMKGYYRMPGQTAQAIDADGWLHSGDLASMDPKGYLRIVGRLKDMIIRGGENVYPAEVEGVLMRHPKVSEVQVVGVPDDYMGEEGAAFVRVRAGESITEAEMVDFCRTHLARHKWPRHWRFVDAFPTTPSGKIRKFELRALMVEDLAANR